MLKQRLLTAAIGIPLLLYAIIWAPSWVFSVVFVAATGLSAFELVLMLSAKMDLMLRGNTEPAKISSRTNALICSGIAIFFAGFYAYAPLDVFVRILGFGIPFLIVAATFSDQTIDVGIGRVFVYLAGLAYSLFPWMAILELQRMSPSAGYLIMLLSIVWMGDTGGYFGGRFIGGKIFSKKLAPSISPKKTWEGSLVGLAASVVSAFIVNECYSQQLGAPFVLICVGFLGGAAGQVGDLVESAFKRFSGVKDSGTIVPGHGGLLDRIDGLLLSGPVVLLLLTFL